MATDVNQGAVPETAVATAGPLALPVPLAIPAKKVLPWAILGGIVMLLAFYFVGAEQGATHLFSGMSIHEFVHDARHLLGFPCH